MAQRIEQSYSSVGQSATLIMQRSAVQLCLGLQRKRNIRCKKAGNLLHLNDHGISPTRCQGQQPQEETVHTKRFESVPFTTGSFKEPRSLTCCTNLVRVNFLRYIKVNNFTVDQNQKSEQSNAGSIVQSERKAMKGDRWMPRLSEAMKDVISCDKPGLGANDH